MINILLIPKPLERKQHSHTNENNHTKQVWAHIGLDHVISPYC